MKLVEKADDVLGAIDCGCSAEEIRASMEWLRGEIDRADNALPAAQ